MEGDDPQYRSSTRRGLLRRFVMSVFIAIPVAKEVVFPGAGLAKRSEPMYVDCVDQPCQWAPMGGSCCCWCGQFMCGGKWGCFDPMTGTLCKCACYSSGCDCHSLAPCMY